MLRAKLAIAALLAALAVGGFLLPRPPSVDTVLRQYAVAQSNTVLIVTDDGGQGSGVVIKRGNRLFVWTAAHVVKDSADVVVKQFYRFEGRKGGELVLHGRVIFSDEKKDYALVWIVDAPPSLFEGAKFDSGIPKVGTRIVHCGNFLGAAFDGSVSEGIVSQVGVQPGYKDWPWPDFLDQAVLSAMPGSSGGAVFLASNLKCIGLVVGAPGRGSLGFVCYVPTRTIAGNTALRWALYGNFCPSDEQLLVSWELRKLEIELAQ